MKNYKQSETIQPGELTELRGQLLKARRRKPALPCFEQCRAALPSFASKSAGCSAFCTRWLNGKDLVFTPAVTPQGDYTVVETEYARDCRISSIQAAARLKQKAAEAAMQLMADRAELLDE